MYTLTHIDFISNPSNNNGLNNQISNYVTAHEYAFFKKQLGNYLIFALYICVCERLDLWIYGFMIFGKKKKIGFMIKIPKTYLKILYLCM